MRAIKVLREETRRRAERSDRLKTHTEQHHATQRRGLSQQTESEALFQQKLDRLVEQKREQQRRDRQCQQRLDALTAQRQRVAAMLRVHMERNEKLNNELVASSHPSTNKTVSDEASKELEASSRLNLDLSLQLVASFNKEVSKELGAAPCRAPPGGEQCDHQAIMVSLSLASAARSIRSLAYRPSTHPARAAYKALPVTPRARAAAHPKPYHYTTHPNRPRAGFGGTRRWTRMQRQGRTWHWPSMTTASMAMGRATATAAGATPPPPTSIRPTKPAKAGGT